MKIILFLISSTIMGQTENAPTAPVVSQSATADSSQIATLKTLLDANVTNSTQFRRGQMSLRLRMETAELANATLYDMVVRWSGQSVACDYVQRDWPKTKPEPEWAGPPNTETPGLSRMVAAPGMNTTFYRLANAVGPGSQPQFFFFTAGSERLDIRTFQQRPDQRWFNISTGIQLKFLLETMLAKSSEADQGVRVDGTRVLIESPDAKAKKQCTLEFSLSQGGNAVKFVNWSSKTTRSEFSSRCDWSWTQLPDERWILKSMELETWSADLVDPRVKANHEANIKKRPEAYDPDWERKPTLKTRLEIHDFDPDPKWETNPFDPALWTVAAGTMVEDFTGPVRKVYQFGDEGGDPTQEINALVERLKKKRSFRNPKAK